MTIPPICWSTSEDADPDGRAGAEEALCALVRLGPLLVLLGEGGIAQPAERGEDRPEEERVHRHRGGDDVPLEEGQPGSADRALPACANCHGPYGTGMAPSVPPLAGQHGRYIAMRPRAWRAIGFAGDGGVGGGRPHDPSRAGRAAILSYGCRACHAVPGMADRARTHVGPSLEDLPDCLYPPRYAPATAMPDMGIDETTARDVAADLMAETLR